MGLGLDDVSSLASPLLIGGGLSEGSQQCDICDRTSWVSSGCQPARSLSWRGYLASWYESCSKTKACKGLRYKFWVVAATLISILKVKIKICKTLFFFLFCCCQWVPPQSNWPWVMKPLQDMCLISRSSEAVRSLSQNGIVGKDWPLEAQVSGTSAQALTWTWNHWPQIILHVWSWNTTHPCWFLTAILELWLQPGFLGSLGTDPPGKHPTAIPGDKTGMQYISHFFQHLVVFVSQTSDTWDRRQQLCPTRLPNVVFVLHAPVFVARPSTVALPGLWWQLVGRSGKFHRRQHPGHVSASHLL